MTIETFRVCFGKKSGKIAIMIHNPLDKIIKTQKQWVFKTLGVKLVLVIEKLLITKG
jgi:hypothetical protein